MIECKVRYYHYEVYGDKLVEIDDRISGKTNVFFNKDFSGTDEFTGAFLKLITEYIQGRPMIPRVLVETEVRITELIRTYTDLGEISDNPYLALGTQFNKEEHFNLY